MVYGIFYNGGDRGPGKVIKNLINGLKKNEIAFNINSDGDFNVILQETPRLYGNLNNCFIGPNICVIPPENSQIMNYNNYKKTIVPSDWVKHLYSKWIPEEKMFVWPVGIDTELFNDFSSHEKSNDCLIYFKRRGHGDLSFIISILDKFGQSYSIVEYGNYSESYFLEQIKISRYAIIIDGSESQGIAIQEIMSSNLPLFVWDIEYWSDYGDTFLVPATSIPYWSSECGMIENNYSLIEDSFKIFLEKIKSFSPRNFIVNNMEMGICAKRLIEEISKN